MGGSGPCLPKASPPQPRRAIRPHAEEARDSGPSRSMRPPPSFETGAARPPQDEGGQTNTGATGGPTHVRSETYRESGVDTAEADAGLSRIIARVQRTWPAAGLGRVVLPIGYFANVIEMDGVGLALCTDGVGSKTIIADMMRKYDTIGIDCVAMNVNDMICVGAKPLSLVDYIAVEQADAAMLDAIGAGLCKGARMAQISISRGETAQLKDIVTGFDLVGMAVWRPSPHKGTARRHLSQGQGGNRGRGATVPL